MMNRATREGSPSGEQFNLSAPIFLSPAFLLSLLLAATGFAAPAPAFVSARPVWPAGREKEKNLFVGFRAVFRTNTAGSVILRSAGATDYRAYINGQFLGHGPARGPHGFFRGDEWDITDRLLPGDNVVAFEVAGYNVNSYALLDQPSFVQAEVVTAEGKVLASTDGKGAPFAATILPQRVQKVQRYSFQRPFSEVYRLTSGWDTWRTNASAKLPAAKLATFPPHHLLPRRVAYPEYTLRGPQSVVARGEVTTGMKVEHAWKDRSLTGIGPKLGGYLEKDLESIPSLELQTVANSTNQSVNQLWTGSPLSIASNSWAILDLGCNLTGFLGARVTCHSNIRLFLTFDEILTDGDVNFHRLGCVNIIAYQLQPGTYELESFEPYTLRYLKILVLEGDCEVRNPHLREFAGAGIWEAQFAASDERLNRLFAAGRETFRQNALDIFMDCPSRERAGWLCDSFFTARVAKDLCGDTRIEQNFFENFLLPDKFPYLPEGMLPMCYPADHNDGVFIPNWALWFVVELEEYLARSGDRATVDALRPRVLRLFDYFKKFRNDDGLLEKLDRWVFVEWSAANRFVQDVNYPSNMLYARALETAGRLYDMPDLTREADKIRETIRYQSFDGTFFIDNAVRVDGKLQPTTNRTEVCQYFAFYFDIATPESYPQLWEKLVKDFGPQRKQTKAYPEVHPANAFIGNVLRLELLSNYGVCQQLLDESLAYQLYMADRTGTLWENDGAYASCDHGFASHGGVHVLFRDVLGLRQVDTINKVVQLRFTDSRLDWCEGRIPAADGPVTLRWRKEGGKRIYQVATPAGYAIKVENRSALPAIRQ
jgi:alpha-L-rhamnosidase